MGMCHTLDQYVPVHTDIYIICMESLQLRFGDTVVLSLGTISFILATPTGIPSIPVLSEIVFLGVPALLVLNILDSEFLTDDTVLNRLVRRKVIYGNEKTPTFALEDWIVPIKRFDNHVHALLNRPLLVQFSCTQISSR